MPRYEFTLTLTGEGSTEGEAWTDAVDAFCADAGPNPNPGVELGESNEPIEQEWTVILLYPNYMTDDFGADIYVESTRANDPYEATKYVQQSAVDENCDVVGAGNLEPDDFRCIGVIAGSHSFVLDATSF